MYLKPLSGTLLNFWFLSRQWNTASSSCCSHSHSREKITGRRWASARFADARRRWTAAVWTWIRPSRQPPGTTSPSRTEPGAKSIWATTTSVPWPPSRNFPWPSSVSGTTWLRKSLSSPSKTWATWSNSIWRRTSSLRISWMRTFFRYFVRFWGNRIKSGAQRSWISGPVQPHELRDASPGKPRFVRESASLPQQPCLHPRVAHQTSLPGKESPKNFGHADYACYFGAARIGGVHAKPVNFSGIKSCNVPFWLQELDLSYTQLRELPLGFLHSLKRLRALNLKGNNLKELPSDVLFESHNLEVLNLNYNPITVISTERLVNRSWCDPQPRGLIRAHELHNSRPFPEMPALKILEMSYMPKLRRIENYSMRGLKGLETLICKDNEKLEYISELAFASYENDTVRPNITRVSRFADRKPWIVKWTE